MKKQKKRSKEEAKQGSIPIKRIVLSPRLVNIFGVLIPLLATLSAALYWYLLRDSLGEISLPFDEGFIPLTFAKNLLAHGSYAYNSSGMVTSGATAPLQVLLLAFTGIFFGVDITTSFILGILSYAVAAYVLFRLALLIFEEDQRFAPAAGLLFVASPLTVSAAMSGLPGMMFIAMILLAALYLMQHKPLWFFVFSGLSVWIRPDGLIFILAGVLYYLYDAVAKRDHNHRDGNERPLISRQYLFGGLAATFLVAAYGLFNVILSGSVFPNSVPAKLKYYSVAVSDFWGDVLRFYSSSSHLVLIIFAAIALLFLLLNTIRRRPQPLFLSAAFIVGTILAFWLIFPFILSMHALIATFPFFLLLSLWGMHVPWKGIGSVVRQSSNIVIIVISMVAVSLTLLLSVLDWENMRVVHQRTVVSQLTRSIPAANWLSHNTTAADAIATDYPGALGFYTDCRIVDMTGVVSPEVIPIIGDLSGLGKILDDQSVKMIVTQRDNFEIVNVSPFWMSNRTAPPVMEIHPYISGKTHIMPQHASALNTEAAVLMQEKRNEEAKVLLEKSFRADPHSSRTNTLLGLVSLELSDTTKAEYYLREALRLDSEYTPAMVPLGDILVARKDYRNGLPLLEQAHLLNPASIQARSSWRTALKAQRADSLEALGIHTLTITR